MSFESMAEGRVRVDGADRRRKTVSRVRAVDREGPSSEQGVYNSWKSWKSPGI